MLEINIHFWQCKSFARKIFKLDLSRKGAGFFPIETFNQLSLKRRRDSDFCNYEKREITTFANFPCEFFLARYPFVYLSHYFVLETSNLSLKSISICTCMVINSLRGTSHPHITILYCFNLNSKILTQKSVNY